MYIGSTSSSGLHHLVYEIVDNSIDEALAGFCNRIEVVIEEGNIICVRDNGRGIPVDIQEQTGTSALDVVFTVLHAGGKFGGGGYKVSGGLHGVGASVVNALSEWLEVQVHRNGKFTRMKFSRGDIIQPLTVVGDTDRTGTIVRFKPDPEDFETIEFDYETLHIRMRNRPSERRTAHIHRGQAARQGAAGRNVLRGRHQGVCVLDCQNKTVLHDNVIYMFGKRKTPRRRIALQYNDLYNLRDNNLSPSPTTTYTPRRRNARDGVQGRLTKGIKRLRPEGGILKEGEKITGEDCREGIVAVISVKLVDAQFEARPKLTGQLGNAHPCGQRGAEKLTDFLEENPAVAKVILEKGRDRQQGQGGRRRARRTSAGRTPWRKHLPGKLADCNERDPALTEIYIVEGDSAGGSAIEGRDSRFQAILPLWGKTLNVEKSRADKVYSNDKLAPIITALGAGIGEDFDIKKLRYHKVIIMADADVDGSHIRTLLLTFFFRMAP